MPKRPAASGYARLAQADEEDEYNDRSDDDPLVLSRESLDTYYAPIQPGARPELPSGAKSAGTQTPVPRRGKRNPNRRRRSSTVDVKAINARLERWAEEIASKFSKLGHRRGKSYDEDALEIHHSVFQPPPGITPVASLDIAEDRMSKMQFDDVVESVRVAIELGVHPKMISQGSSGSYFARDSDGRVVGVFKPKDEEPYATKNPKWTKWIHRNLFPFAFGRACLIPNLSYVSEAAAYVLDSRLQTNIVPYTDVVYFTSIAFNHDFWDRRAYYRKRKPLPAKVGSLQTFLKGYKDATQFLKQHPWPDQAGSTRVSSRGRSHWTDHCRPGTGAGYGEDDEDEEADIPGHAEAQRRREFWTDALQLSFREELEKLVVLDYIMRNTDRGLDNWMIHIDEATQKATLTAEPPKSRTGSGAGLEPGHPDGPRSASPYLPQDRMNGPGIAADPDLPKPNVRIGAIDNSLSWPWKHPDAWRSFPFGWLFLPVSLIGQPFTERTRAHFLPLLTSKQWWAETRSALRRSFKQDADFQDKMFARQMAVVKGQAWNVVETLKTPGHGPLELARRARVHVWDDVVDIPTVALPMRFSPVHSPERMREADAARAAAAGPEEMDIATSGAAAAHARAQAGLIDLGVREGANGVPRASPFAPRSSSDEQTTVVGASPAQRELRRSQALQKQQQRRQQRRHASFGGAVGAGSGSTHGYYDAAGGDSDDEGAGDLGFAAAREMEGNRRKVIVERLETVRGREPLFTWC